MKPFNNGLPFAEPFWPLMLLKTTSLHSYNLALVHGGHYSGISLYRNMTDLTNQYKNISDLTCKVWLEYMLWPTTLDNGQIDGHMITIALWSGVAKG